MRVLHKSVLRIAFLLLFAGVFTAMVVPDSALDLLVRQFPWVRRATDFLATVATGWDVDHVVSFAAVGFAAHFGWRRWRAWHVALGALLVACLAEVVQIWVPGREPAFSHAILDLLGAVLGFTLAWLLSYAWSNRSLPQEYQPSTHWVGDNADHWRRRD